MKRLFLLLTSTVALTLAAEETPSASTRFPFAIGPIEAGSAADFSRLNHRPAGKYGELTVTPDGEFKFVRGGTVRFFGVNVVGSRLLGMTHEEADREAGRLAALGVNLVRFHHTGASWVRNTPLYADHTRTLLEFNDAALEKLDYFFAALKRRGIYLTCEMVDSQWAPPELPTGLAKPARQYNAMKLRLMFDPVVQAYARKWIRAFYCRKNRYTGLSLFEDPQMAMLDVVNEIALIYHDAKLANHLDADGKAAVERLYHTHRRQSGQSAADFDFTLRHADSARFWLALMQNAGASWRQFLRDCGYRGPIAFSNCAKNFSQCANNLNHDFVDQHLYWGYAKWLDGKFRPDPFGRWSSLLKAPRDEHFYCNELFTRLAQTAMVGKPVVSGEHRTCPGGGSNPVASDLRFQSYRAVGIPFMAAIQAFQQWDGFFIYALHGPEPANRGQSGRMGSVYDVDYDTTYLGTFPIGSYLLRSGAIAPARRTVVLEVDDAAMFASPSTPFYNDALFHYPEQHRVLCLYPGQNRSQIPAGAEVMPLNRDLGLKTLPPVIRADTGEFYRNWREGYFVVDSPRVQGAEGFFNRTEHFSLRDTEWHLTSPFGVVFLLPCDDRPLRESSRMLLYAGGDCVNTPDPSTRLDDGKLPGRAPVLLDPVRGSLAFKSGRRFTAWALGERGERRTPPVATSTEKFTFDTGRDRTIWYELVPDRR